MTEACDFTHVGSLMQLSREINRNQLLLSNFLPMWSYVSVILTMALCPTIGHKQVLYRSCRMDGIVFLWPLLHYIVS